jgi:hypothetical protein
MCAPGRMSIRGGLPKSTDTRRPRLVSQKWKRHRQRTHPLPTKLAPATIKGARQPRSLRATKGCLQCCRRITCGRSGVCEDTCGPAADATDYLRLAAGCRPSGGAVDSPPHDLGRDFPHVRLRLPRLYERGSAPASMKAATLGVYVVTTCPSPQHWSLLVSLNGISHRE